MASLTGPGDEPDTKIDFCRVRPGRPDDHPFIVETWLLGHSQSVIGREMGPRYVYEQKLLMRDVLSRPSTSVRTAVLNDDEDAIVGYAVLGGLADGHEALIPTIFYVFVKPDFRKMGVAKGLLGDLEHRQVTYTHKPAYPLRCDLPKPENWTFSYYRNWNDA